MKLFNTIYRKVTYKPSACAGYNYNVTLAPNWRASATATFYSEQLRGKKNKFIPQTLATFHVHSLPVPLSQICNARFISCFTKLSACFTKQSNISACAGYSLVRLLSYQKLRISINDSILQFIVATGVRWVFRLQSSACAGYYLNNTRSAQSSFGRVPSHSLQLLSHQGAEAGSLYPSSSILISREVLISLVALPTSLNKVAQAGHQLPAVLRFAHSRFILPARKTTMKKYLGIFYKWQKGIKSGFFEKKPDTYAINAPDALKGYYSSFIIKGYGKRAKRSKSLFLFKIGIRKQGGTLPKQIIPKSLFIKSKKKRTRFKFFTINKQVQKSLFNKIIKLQGSSKKLPAFSYKDIGIRIFGKKVKKKVRRV